MNGIDTQRLPVRVVDQSGMEADNLYQLMGVVLSEQLEEQSRGQLGQRVCRATRNLGVGSTVDGGSGNIDNELAAGRQPMHSLSQC